MNRHKTLKTKPKQANCRNGLSLNFVQLSSNFFKFSVHSVGYRTVQIYDSLNIDFGDLFVASSPEGFIIAGFSLKDHGFGKIVDIQRWRL